MERFTELILPHIIGIMIHKRESLNPKERRAQESFLKKLQIRKRKTKQPLVIAMVGLVGSGKSSVAQEFAKHISGTVIEGDEIRVCLRKERESYKSVRKITEDTAVEIIKQGGNVVIDADHIDQRKRASLQEKLRKVDARLVFVRTYTDYDIMAGRVISASYSDSVDDFFGGASSEWGGQNKGAAVKLREMWRRTPQHYQWLNKGGGKWILKKLSFAVLAEIDTADPQWKDKVKQAAKKLLK